MKGQWNERDNSEMFVYVEENGFVPLSHSIGSQMQENQNSQPKEPFLLKGYEELQVAHGRMMNLGTALY